MPNFCMLPGEAERWISDLAARRALVVRDDPRLLDRRWVGSSADAPHAALERPGQFGLVMVDLPRREEDLLTLGSLGFKAYADYPEAAAIGRKLAELLRRELRRVCPVPLLARNTQTGATDDKASCWASEAAAAEAQRGLVIKQFSQGFVDFIPDDRNSK